MSIESLEEILESLNQHIATLTSIAQRASGKSGELFAKTELRTLQLTRLHHTCNVLRTLIRVFAITAKLEGKGRGWAEGGRELVQRAGLVAELEELTSETDLKGIAVVEKDLLTVPRLRAELKDAARDCLRKALKVHIPLQSRVVFVKWPLEDAKSVHRCKCRLGSRPAGRAGIRSGGPPRGNDDGRRGSLPGSGPQ